MDQFSWPGKRYSYKQQGETGTQLKRGPLPHLLSERQANQIVDDVYSALKENPVFSKDIKLYKMNELTAEQKTMLTEMHFISMDLANSERGAVIINHDKTVSIMINEEDHLRIQVMLPGLQLEEALRQIDKIDDLLEEKLDFAFDEKSDTSLHVLQT